MEPIKSTDPGAWLKDARQLADGAHEVTDADVLRSIDTESPQAVDMATLLSPAADRHLEEMAQRALALTRRHFGRTISLYVPLYLSNYCCSGCAYCGFASDRDVSRRRMELDEVERELHALKSMGFEEVLMLTGERTPHADFPYLKSCVSIAASLFHLVTIEVFPMSSDEYAELARAGCTGLTLYQETYDPTVYAEMHRWGPKKDYHNRIVSPENALSAGIRTAGIGALLGLADPVVEALCILAHARHLTRNYWQAGISVSFPRIRPQPGGFRPPFTVSDRFLARLIFAFRICLPDVPLVLSTRESPAFRDGMAGIGVSKMSVASRTTVGGYSHNSQDEKTEQFSVSDSRQVSEFCQMLQHRNLEPVFKNWDAMYRAEPMVITGDSEPNTG